MEAGPDRTPQHPRRRRWVLAAVLAVVAGGILTRPPDAAGADLVTRRATFTAAWKRIYESHFDMKRLGPRWVAARRKFEPLALKAKTEPEFYALLNEMIDTLGQSHLQVIPPGGGSAADPRRPSGSADPGMEVRVIGDEALVTGVEPGSAAAAAGVRPGYQLLKVDGRPVAETLTALAGMSMYVHAGPVEKRLYRTMTVDAGLHGAAGTQAQVTLKDGDDKEQTFSLTRRDAPGEIVIFGNMPPMPARLETRRLEGGQLYIRFNLFVLPLLERIRNAIQKGQDAPGIVFDLRGNHGGIGAMVAGIARALFDKQVNLGTMRMREGEMRFPVFPDSAVYRGPIAILTDESSLSTSEIMAGSFQELKRAIVVGEPTGGMVLPSQFEPLPGGGRLQYVVADFRTPAGVLLEGRGVKPDLPVSVTRRRLLDEGDPVLKAALAALATKAP